MAEKSLKTTPPGVLSKEQEDARLAAALRENLKRRKAKTAMPTEGDADE